MWYCVKDMTHLNRRKSELNVFNEQERANEFNMFYKRFNTEEGRDLSVNTCDPNKDKIVIDTDTVVRALMLCTQGRDLPLNRA